MKERSWRPKREFLGLFVDIHRHHGVLRLRKIKQLLTVTAPARICAALRRYLGSACGFGEMGDVNLLLPGFVRDVGNPLAVGRECRSRIPELGLHQSKRLPVSGKGKYPNRGVRTRWGLRIGQIAAISTDRKRNLSHAGGLENCLRCPGSVALDAEDVR